MSNGIHQYEVRILDTKNNQWIYKRMCSDYDTSVLLLSHGIQLALLSQLPFTADLYNETTGELLHRIEDTKDKGNIEL